MKNTDIHLGFIYLINGQMERVSCVDCDDEGLFVNGVPLERVEPLLLDDKLFDDFGFKYYNGWYCPFDEGMDSVTFLKIFDGYAVTLGNHEVEDLTIRYFHEMQAVIYGLKKVLV
jgi:hypothetical protein